MISRKQGGIVDSITHHNGSRDENNRVCRVAYALNAKKLRKSDAVSGSSLSQSPQSSSPLQMIPDAQAVPLWNGGGLADIITTSNHRDGVCFVPFKYNIECAGFGSESIEKCPSSSSISNNSSSSSNSDIDSNNNKNSNNSSNNSRYARHLSNSGCSCAVDEDETNYDIIIHKLTEDLADLESNPESQAKIRALESYLKTHPRTVIVDPIASIRTVIDRAQTVHRLSRALAVLPDHHRPFSLPRFIVLDSMHSSTSERSYRDEALLQRLRDANIVFPIICKPIAACGTPASHQMAVVVCPSDISMVFNHQPCIIQQYYNHAARLFKVYAMASDAVVGVADLGAEAEGFDVQVFERPSLPDLPTQHHNEAELDPMHCSVIDVDIDVNMSGDRHSRDSEHRNNSYYMSHAKESPPKETAPSTDEVDSVFTLGTCRSCAIRSVEFDSRKAYPKLADFQQVSAGAIDKIKTQQDGQEQRLHSENKIQVHLQHMQLFRVSAAIIRDELGLSLFGFDVIIPVASEPPLTVLQQQLVVVDVNYFPSYKEMVDFPLRLRSFLRRKAGLSAAVVV